MNNIHILKGDITQAKVDAVVNAANPTMLGGGGVDGAIHRAAGPALLAACRAVKTINGIRCPFGEARITAAGNLSANHVIHTAGPIYRNENDPAIVLKSSYENALQLALDYNCHSIAFPAISCGAYGYPLEEAASIALGTCQQSDYRQLHIYFYLVGEDIFNVWVRTLEKYNA